MSCFHPLKGFQIGLHESGKPNYKITSYDTDYVVKDDIGNWHSSTYDNWKIDLHRPKVTESIDIPCGHCVGCLLERSRQWADRCMLEAKYHEKNSFLTLTYSDENLPAQGFTVDDDGVCSDAPFFSLDKRDLQLFMKRLRKEIYPLKCRYFACGEYGSHSLRPHIHIILFGYDFSDDRVFYKKNFRGEKYFTSPKLDKLWDKGIAVICDVSWDTCAYVARYCLKKRDNQMKDFYNEFNVQPEFTTMSRRPGIARQYYDDNKEKIYETMEIFISDEKGSRKLYPPRYFDRLYDVDYPSDFERIKKDRVEFAKMRKELELQNTDLDYLEYLKVKEYNFHNKTKIFNERSRFNETSI